MTKTEFTRWLEHYMAVFPETAEWIGRVPNARRAAMLDAWLGLLAETEYRDARAATDLMFAGDDPAFPPLGVMFGDRERTPSHVQRLSRLVRHRRQQEQEKRQADLQRREDQLHGGATRYKHSTGELYNALLEMLDAGDADAVRKMRAMADELPAPGDPGYSPADGYSELFPK